MLSRGQRVKLGIFIAVAMFLFFGGVILLAGLKLWEKHDYYHVFYTDSVSGLDIGSPVKLSGVRIGNVKSILISTERHGSVKVQLAIKPNTPIKRDSQAIQSAVGITGLKFIELLPGSKGAKLLPPDSEILAGESFVDELSGKATAIAIKTEKLIQNLLWLTEEKNIIKINTIIDNISNSTKHADDLLVNNAENISKLVISMGHATKSLNKAVRSFDDFIATNKVLTYKALENFSTSVKDIKSFVSNLKINHSLKEFNKTMIQARQTLSTKELTQAATDISLTAASLKRTSESLDSAIGQSLQEMLDIMDSLYFTARNLKDLSREVKERPWLLLRGEEAKEREF